MSVVNVGAFAVSQASYKRARSIVENRPAGTRKTANDVLASIREMKPGWTVSTTTADWGEGFRNLAICRNTLNRMAEDPEAMVRYKALILDLEDIVPKLEEWAKENPDGDKTLEFGISLDLDGNIRAMAIVRTLLGGETRSEFTLSSENKGTWADLISQKLSTLREGRAEEADGSQSWQA